MNSLLKGSSGRWMAVAAVVLMITAVARAQLLPHGNTTGGGWVKLGTAHIDGNNDHDRIQGNGHDTYHRLRVRVIGATVQFDRIEVEYGDHTHGTIPFRFTISSGGTRTADIPDGPRDLTYVEFYYRKGPWTNKPEVQLYALP